MMEKDKAVGRLTAVSAAVLFGCESVGVQLCYQDGFNIITLILTRYSLALVAFLFLAMYMKAPLLVIKGQRLNTLLLGLCYVGITWFLFSALSRLPAALAILFFYSYPSFTAIISRIFYKYKLGWVKICSLTLSIVGLVLLYWSSAETIAVSGVIFAVAAALCNAIKLNISGEVLPKLNIYSYCLNITGIVLVFALLMSIFGGNLSFSVTPISIVYMVFLAIGITCGAVLLLNKALRIIPAVDVSIIFLLEPMVATFTAFLIFNDILATWQLIGAVLLLIAVALPQVQELFLSSKKPEQEKIEINQNER